MVFCILCKTLRLRCLTGFWKRLCVLPTESALKFYLKVYFIWLILFIASQIHFLKGIKTFGKSFFVNQYVLFKDIYRENTPSNKTKALTRKYEYAQFGNWYIKSAIQKQRSRGGLSKRCSENMLQIYRRTPHFGMGVLL